MTSTLTSAKIAIAERDLALPISAPVVSYSIPMANSRWMEQGIDTHADLLEKNTHPDQRKVRINEEPRSRVNRYYADMIHGRWSVGADNGITLGRVGESGTYRLLNGQHRLHAAVKAWTEKGVYVPFELHYYTFQSEDSLNEFFSSIDDTFNRTISQRLTILGTADSTGLPVQWAKNASSALRLIDSDFKGSSASALINAKDIDAAIRATKGASYLYYRASAEDQKMAKATARAAVMGIGILTFVFQPDLAAKFWADVCHPEVLVKGSPVMTLREFLLTTPTSGGNGPNGALGYATKVSRAWNAYARGESKLTFLKEVVSNKPMEITGTPFNGRATGVGKVLISKWIQEGSK